jgi:hypothetical protein
MRSPRRSAGNKAEAAYRRDNLFDKRRRMEERARHVSRAEIVDFPGVRQTA